MICPSCSRPMRLDNSMREYVCTHYLCRLRMLAVREHEKPAEPITPKREIIPPCSINIEEWTVEKLRREIQIAGSPNKLKEQLHIGGGRFYRVLRQKGMHEAIRPQLRRALCAAAAGEI